ncbi:glycosyltransferase family 4 protein [Geothrix fuzhouensis]|uniref:glycosyltransferase family 4 protein n=1 Tax=Geothrix fuzhouensis TaxID=2966451 RepID=UPI00214792D2|nr:glycosyltransferase family 4 protein [Geothrix fuzhouensis]
MGPYDFNLCRGLSHSSVNVALYTSDATSPPTHPDFAFRPVYCGIFGRGSVLRRGFRYLRGTLLALLSSVREGRRVCHFHFFSVGPLEWMNVTLARLLGRRVVITAHDVEAFVSTQDTPGLPRLAYGMAHAVIAHNHISREELLNRMGLPQDRIHVIPAGNHLESIPKVCTPAEARVHLGLPDSGAVLLFFGQIKEVKGLDVLLEAMPSILSQHPDTTLVIAGRPWKLEFEEYQGLIDKLSLNANCITHIRFIPDDELPLYYQACDLVTLPYRKIYQSDVVLMAMSYGKAVVTSNIPGMTEMIRDRDTGFLFQSGDPMDLARVVGQALSDPELRGKVASGGLDLMREKFGWDSIGRATAALYRSLY